MPYEELEEYQQKSILHGGVEDATFFWKKHKLTRKWDGVIKIAYDMLKDEKELGDYMSEKTCDTCGGYRLKKESLAVRLAKKNIADILELPIDQCLGFFQDEKNFASMKAQHRMIAEPILKEIKERLYFLFDVGLGYICLLYTSPSPRD